MLIYASPTLHMWQAQYHQEPNVRTQSFMLHHDILRFTQGTKCVIRIFLKEMDYNNENATNATLANHSDSVVKE